MKYTTPKKNSGLVMVFALLILTSLTILGVSSVSSSLIQSKMAASMEKRSSAFDAAESAIAAVMFESEDDVLISSAANDPLTDARAGTQIVLANQALSCFDDANWTNRTLTKAGLVKGTQHTVAGHYTDKPVVESWSRTAFVKEQPCIGSSNVIGGSNISCHVFIVKGCGKMQDSNYVVANTMNASVFAPATQ